jgi:predicted transcriptional regulator
MLETLITSKTRIRILVKFFINAANFGHLRGLAEEMNESTNAIRKELNNLSEAGYLEKKASQNKVSYKANTKHPLFETLQQIVFKHIGLDAITDMILERMGKVKQIIILGDYANGIDSGVIEVLIVGNQLNESYIDKLATKIEAEIKRKVIFTLNDNTIPNGLVIYENLESIEY